MNKSYFCFLLFTLNIVLQSSVEASQNGSVDLYGRTTTAQAGTNNALILVKHNSVLKQDFATRVCKIISESMPADASSADCFSEAGTSQADFQSAVAQKNPKYVYLAELNLEGYTEIQVQDRSQKNPDFINSLSFRILNIESQAPLVESSLASIHHYLNHLPRFGGLLAELAWNAEMGGEQNRAIRSQDPIENYKSFMGSGLDAKTLQSRRNYLLAGTALLGSLAIGKKWYDTNLDLNSKDWDFPNFADSIKAKFHLRANAVAFDDNGWKLNRDHTYAGFSYYMACRGSNFTALESLTCNLAASTAWELLVESREVLAINDQIFTAGGGSILAEAFFQMQCFVLQNGNAVLRSSVGAPLKTLSGANKFTSEKFLQSKYPGTYKDNMCAQRRGGKFEIEIGYASANKSDDNKSVNFFRLYNITTNQKFSDNENFKGISEGLTESELSLQLEKLGANVDQKISSQLVFAAYALVKANQDNKDPNIFYIGPAVGLDISDTQSSQSSYGLVHVLGASGHLSIVSNNHRITARLGVFGDSVMVRSLAVEKFLPDNPDKVVLANIRDNFMYHGFGVTKKGSISYENEKTSFTFSFLQANTASTFWRQRTNPAGGEKVTYDVKLKDQASVANAQVDLKISKSFKIRYEHTWERQRSQADAAYQTTSKTNKNRVSLVYHF